MKKQLLFTLALLASVFIASAQSNTLTFTGGTADAQTFSFGNTAGIYALSDGSDFSQGAFFISYNGEVGTETSPAGPVSETFGLNTSGNSVSKTLTFKYRKRAAMTAEVRISIPGQSDVTYTLGDTSAEDGGNNTLVERTLEYTTAIPLSTATTNITIQIDELVQNSASNVRFRVYDVIVNGTLSTTDIDAQKVSVSAYPNPVNNSFQIEANRSVESIELYTVTGRLVKTFSQESAYDISALATGIYIANIKTELGSKTIKIVKQ